MASSSSIHTRTDREQRLADELRVIALDTIGHREIAEVQAAFGVAKSGLERLLAETKWDLRVAFRVVDCLNVSVIDSLMSSVNGKAKP